MLKKLIIQLPVHPKTVGELQLNRHWIRAISNAHFNTFYRDYYNGCFFNPAFLQLLFPPGSTAKLGLLKIHVDRFSYPTASVEILIQLAPHICARSNSHIFALNSTTIESLLELACSTAAVPDSFKTDIIREFDQLQSLVKV